MPLPDTTWPDRLEPFVLDGQYAWRVERGTLGVFFQRVDEDGLGARRYLFAIEAGDAILWTSSASAHHLFTAVPLEPSRVVVEALQRETMRVTTGDFDAARRLEAWMARVDAHIRASGVDAPALDDVRASPPADLENALGQLHRRWLEALDRIDDTADRAWRRQVEARERLNDRLTHASIDELVGSAASKPVLTGATDDPLLAAFRRVGAASGVDVSGRPHPSSGRATLEALLRASNAHSRTVVLTPGWWRRDGGPLLAFLADDATPVALLPARRWFGGFQYDIVSDNGSIGVDAEVAERLAPQAYVLYCPLPEAASPLAVARHVLRPNARALVTALAAGGAAAIVGMVAPQATAVIIESAIPDANRPLLVQFGMALVASVVGVLLFDAVQALSLLGLTTTGTARLQGGVWDRLLRQGPAFFRQFTAGDLGARALAPIELRFILNETTLSAWMGALASVVYLGLMFVYSRRLATIGLIVALCVVCVDILSSRPLLNFTRLLQQQEGRLNGLLIQLVGAVGKLRIAGAERRAFALWAGLHAEKVRLKQEAQVITDRLRLVHLLLLPGTTVLFYWAAYRELSTASGTLTLGTFLAFMVVVGMFLGALVTIGDGLPIMLHAAGLWQRVQPILEGNVETHARQNNPGVLAGRIRLDHVTFRYRDDGPLTLDDVSIHADAGESIAIVGPSGSGKSTIVNLLLRFEIPVSGAVYYDDHDLNSLDVLALRRQLGVVTQDARILAGSIFDNIAAGAVATLDQAWEAAQAAALDHDIRQMPMGMHTFVAEGGANISGGQRQRMLIARALLKKPSVLIMDEATSALDNRTQAIVTESLDRLQVTRIVVAHRLSTIRLADRIYVIVNGRVAQHGSFDELLVQDGWFARAMARQVA